MLDCPTYWQAYDAMSDFEIIAAICEQNDVDALSYLVVHRCSKVTKSVRSIFRNRAIQMNGQSAGYEFSQEDLAGRLTEEILRNNKSILRNFHGFNEKGKASELPTYLHVALLRNVWRTFRKLMKQSQEQSAGSLSEEEWNDDGQRTSSVAVDERTPETEVLSESERKRLAALVMELPDDESKVIFHAHVINKVPIKAIAQSLNKKPNTVSQQFKRIRAKLQKLYEEGNKND